MIKTERLTIKPFENDRASLSRILLSEEIKKTYMIPDFESEESLNKMASRLCELSLSDGHFVRGIYLSDELIGFVNDVEIKNCEIELGYVILPELWGRGYATEMLTAVISWLFGRGYTAVRAGAFEENGASIRVMEKSGMNRLEMTESISYRGRAHNCVYYEIRSEN